MLLLLDPTVENLSFDFKKINPNLNPNFITKSVLYFVSLKQQQNQPHRRYEES